MAQIKGNNSRIDPMHKWLPITSSFVTIKIRPTNLVFELIIQKNFYSFSSHSAAVATNIGIPKYYREFSQNTYFYFFSLQKPTVQERTPKTERKHS